MDLHLRVLHREVGRGLLAALVRFPRVHRAPVAVRVGVRPRRVQRAATEGDQRASHVGVGDDERREHPGVRVPEDVAVVSGGGEAHRRNAERRALRAVREQVEEHGPNHPLERGVALHLDVGLPAASPRQRVLGGERLPAARVRCLRLTADGRPRVLALAREGRDLGEGVGAARDAVEGHLDPGTVSLARGSGGRPAEAGGPGDSGGLGHHPGSALGRRGEREQRARLTRGRRAGAHGHVTRIPDVRRSPRRVGTGKRGQLQSPRRRLADEGESDLHPTLRAGCEIEPNGGEVRIRPGDERLDRHGRAPGAGHPLVAGAHGAGAHVQHLPVAAHRAGSGRAVEPPLAVEHRDRGPGREGGDPGHVAGEVLVDARHKRWARADAEGGDHHPDAPVADRRRGGAGGVAGGEMEGGVLRDGRRGQPRDQKAERRKNVSGRQRNIHEKSVTLSGAKGTMQAWPPSLCSG